MKKIGVITSGGDCGGLNAVIKGAAQMANDNNVKCFVIPNGYAGLYNLTDFEELVELTPDRVDLINNNLAGSEAGHSRVKIKKIDDANKYEKIKEGLKKFSIDGLVISGGDDTGSVIVDLSENGIACVHAPKTMDLDLQTYSVGADSTISRIAEFAEDLKTTGRTHNRIIVVEVFGRYAGHTAFRGGVAADSDAVLIPEIPVDFDALYEDVKEKFCNRIVTSDVNAGTYSIIVAEGLKNADGSDIVDESSEADAFGHKKLAGAGKFVCQQLTKRFKEDASIKEFMKEQKMFVEGIYEVPEIRSVAPGHLVRCGHASAYDANFGLEAGAAAVQLLMNDITGVTVVKVEGSEIRYVDTKKAIEQRHVDLDLVTLHEHLGMSFGRKKQAFKPTFKKVEGKIERHL